MKIDRSAGVLLPIFSLPSSEGIGTFGADAYRFVDWLKAAKQKYWQVLPFSPTWSDGNPYAAYSSYGGEYLLISLVELAKDGLIEKIEDVHLRSRHHHYVDYAYLKTVKHQILFQAFQKFMEKADAQQTLDAFVQRENNWILDFAMFVTLTKFHGDQWWLWPEDFKRRKTSVLAQFAQDHREEFYYCYFVQWVFKKQWTQLKKYANEQGISIIGDIPIFVSHHSLEVWKNPKLFLLDQNTCLPQFVSGAPPDMFSASGQVWGTPVYHWGNVKESGFQLWIEKLEHVFELYDIVRLDHFRGFDAFWEIPNHGPHIHALMGKWVKVPAYELFDTLRARFPKFPIIVEDLGEIHESVHILRDHFNFPGMKILQFAFNSNWHNNYLPMHYHTNNCVVYTGTHDNNTTLGWLSEIRGTHEEWMLGQVLLTYDFQFLNWKFIEIAMHTRADLAMTPLQDVIGLGSEGRINRPGSIEGNWRWRFSWDQLPEGSQHTLKMITQQSNRG